MEVPQKTKKNCHMIQQFQDWAHTQRKLYFQRYIHFDGNFNNKVIHSNQDMEATKISMTEERIKKMWYTHTMQ